MTKKTEQDKWQKPAQATLTNCEKDLITLTV